MDDALEKYLLLPSRETPDEFAKYITIYVGGEKFAFKAKLTLPFHKTWMEVIQQHVPAPMTGSSFVLWCREIGVIDVESPVCNDLDSISSLAVWIMKSSSCYALRDGHLKYIFSCLGHFKMLAVLASVCKRWRRIAVSDDVVEAVYRRVIWLWEGIDGEGTTETTIWESDRHRLGLSYFALTRCANVSRMCNLSLTIMLYKDKEMQSQSLQTKANVW